MKSEADGIVLAASFTIDPVKESIAGWLDELNMAADICVAPAGQIIQQLLDPESMIRRNTGMNIVFIRIEDFVPGLHDAADACAIDSPVAVKNIQDIMDAVGIYAANSARPLVLCVCPAATAINLRPEALQFIKKAESQVITAAMKCQSVVTVSTDEIFNRYPIAEYYDFHSDKVAQIPYTLAFYSVLGTMVARKIFSIREKPYKVIVLDCDNTLWKGVCGEDGIDSLDVSGPYRELQEFMIAQMNQGMLLALCSKNNEEDVRQVFEERTGMALKLDHIAAKRINWKEKSENLRSIAQELNVGTDSLIFIDDDSFECGEVRANCPGVLVLQLQAKESISSFLKNAWVFDHEKITEEDKNRTMYYKQDSARKEYEKTRDDYDSFINSLGLVVEMNAVKPEHVERSSQLTHRVNQFNFTGIRMSEAEVKKLMDDASMGVYLVRAGDRFGDYGQVGLVVASKKPTYLEIESCLLSCRALGKGVEFRMFSEMSAIAEKAGVREVRVWFRNTSRNMPASRFLSLLGKPESEKDGLLFYKFKTEFLKKVNLREFRARGQATPEDAVQQVNEAKTASQASRDQKRQDAIRDIAVSVVSADDIYRRIRGNETTTARSGKEIVPPSTPNEKIVMGIWEEIFNTRNISIHDDFFKLGGDSLKAVLVLTKLQNIFQIELPMHILFEDALTVHELSKTLATYQLDSLGGDRVDEEMKGLENMSDEDVEKLLEQELETNSL